VADLDPHTAETLRARSIRDSVSNNIISGRSIEELFGRIRLETPVYAGNHGLEIFGRNLRFVEPLAWARRERLERLCEDLAARLWFAAGARAEYSGGGAAAGDPDIHVLLLPPFSDLEINALVRGSTVVLQKSIREGFGVTVSEALWKKKPVIGGAVGGIKLQVINGVTGFLVHSPEGAASRIVQLLGDRKLRERLGENGYQHVKQNFLLTRNVKDYLLTMLALDQPGESVVRAA
jgi:glycosyltransferase involved in cell wall biosynthesis